MATATFHPDASTESTSVDGQAGRAVTNSLWDDIHGGAGTQRDDDDPVNRANAAQDYGQTTTDRWDNFQRGFFLFDTSALGAGSTVTAATFEIVLTSKQDDFTDHACLVDVNPASNTAIAAADYQNHISTTLQAANVNLSGMTADSSAYTAWTLNSTGLGNIAVAGITKFGLRVGIDVADSDPGGWVLHAQKRTALVWASSEETLSGDKKPKLVVTYTLPPFTSKVIMF
jgi:hypothetical protein